jgi:hypothetical protein
MKEKEIFGDVEKVMGIMNFVDEIGRSYESLLQDISFMLAKRFGAHHAECVYYEALYWIGKKDEPLNKILEECGIKFTERDEMLLKLLKDAADFERKAKETLLRALSLDKAERRKKRHGK